MTGGDSACRILQGGNDERPLSSVDVIQEGEKEASVLGRDSRPHVAHALARLGKINRSW